MIKLSSFLASGVVCFTLNSAAAFAQDVINTPALVSPAKQSGSNIYEPAFFTAYAPRTAFDMIGRIPGFQLQDADNKRGLGQGGANILINKKRLSGKTDARDQLGRITAANVVRIEILEGASLNIPGLTGQVANIVTKNKGVTGTWEWRPEWRENLQADLLDGQVSVSGETGNLAYSATLKNESFRNGNFGPESLYTPDGVVFERRDEVQTSNGDNPGASLDLTWTPKPDHVGNLNLEYNQFNFNSRETSKRSGLLPRGEDLETLFSRAEDEWNFEAGGDYELPVGPGKLKMIGYYAFERSPSISRFDIFDPVLGQTEGIRFFRDADEAETIARTEYSWTPSQGRDWQFSLEGAFNYLDIDSRLEELNITPDPAELDRVEEKRAEATITHTRTISPQWDVQASVGGEYSEISQAGGLTRDFYRPKGFISTTYKPDDSFSIRTKIEREVGQLNFFDFISSVSVQDDFDQAGNANLVPEQSWIGEMEFGKDFCQGNTFKARFYGELISDLVDRIPIGLDGDAVGNIDSATRYGVDFTATIKGERWGLDGMQLDLGLDLRTSSVDDPLLGFSRRLNDDKIYYWQIDFRHDIPSTEWAYGFYADQFHESEVYRLETIQQFNFPVPFSIIYIEHKDVFGLKVRADVRNLFGSSDDFTRTVYTDRRDLGVVDFIEDRSRPFGSFVRVTVSGTF
ncbi:MAG: hypothetical protein EX271_10125 [Acidimicrobiales bacterium]|nr:MAG: hypothetical protein EX271_10125 [Acidimicrobiales bacterium]